MTAAAKIDRWGWRIVFEPVEEWEADYAARVFEREVRRRLQKKAYDKQRRARPVEFRRAA